MTGVQTCALPISTWTVTVATGAGEGFLYLDLTDTTGIADLALIPLAGTFTAGQAYQIEKTAPVDAAVAIPVDGAQHRAATVPTAFSGTAADNTGGVGLAADSTTFTIQRSSDSHYWTGTNWTATSPVALPTTHVSATDGTAAWTSAGTLPNWTATPDGTYTVIATATDRAGNTFSGTPISFTLDNTAPATASVTTPIDGSILRAADGATKVPATFAGDAADNGTGVGLVADSTTFTIQRGTDSHYWNGTDWSATTAVALATTHASTTDGSSTAWTSNVALPDWTATPDGTYTVTATATDRVGNAFTGTPISFTLDNTAPVVASITAPLDGETYRNSVLAALP